MNVLVGTAIMVNKMNLDLVKWNKIYENNKRLDLIFYEKYPNEDIFKKNSIEFLVELGEFLNETKIFKYWSIKKPEKEKVLEEYADNITICLTFFRELNMDLEKSYPHLETKDTIEIANYLYEKVSQVMHHSNIDLLSDIFGNLLYLGNLLGILEEEIINAVKEKHKIIEMRLNSNY